MKWYVEKIKATEVALCGRFDVEASDHPEAINPWQGLP